MNQLKNPHLENQFCLAKSSFPEGPAFLWRSVWHQTLQSQKDKARNSQLPTEMPGLPFSSDSKGDGKLQKQQLLSVVPADLWMAL